MDSSRDDAAARNRFESFKLGLGLPSTGPVGVPKKHSHSRSHSRNLSISSSFSIPPSKSTTVNDPSPLGNANLNVATVSPPASSPSPSPTSPNLVASSKRNSHHRRRSSVSTRHESAELMGVTLPDLPSSTSDDNVNLGDKDSIRRRALWALEGKPDVSFSKVEIPDMSTADMDKMLFDLSTKTSVAPAYGNSLMGSKRDSFKLLGPSSSAKDQLHTLVEEEEEEDDSAEVSEESPTLLPSPTSSVKENVPPSSTPVLAITKPTPSKPRPSNLHLRPLSLTPESLSIVSALPSPLASPTPRSGLRSLSLVDDANATSSIKQSRRASLVISPPPAFRRPVLNLALEQLETSVATSTCDEDSKPTRRSSICYKRSSHGSVTTNIAGLPTPEMTPTFGRRYSNTSSSGDRESISSLSLASNERDSITAEGFFPIPPTPSRPLSASEQHFLYKSHQALLARIAGLERALSLIRRESGGTYSADGSSRPMSVASSRSDSMSEFGVMSPPPSEPTDEILRLIGDLKAERDELKRDADGWRTRVGDMEAQISVLAKRVENERREAWVARSRGGLLEVEKSVLAKRVEALEELQALRAEEQVHAAAAWEAERARLEDKAAEAMRHVAEVEAQLERVQAELEEEKLRVKIVASDPYATPTPRTAAGGVHGLGFASVDSEHSTTDIDPDSSEDDDRFAFKVDDAASRYSYSDETYYDDEEENALAGYEDEEDMDASVRSSSSCSSEEEDYPRTRIMERPQSPTTPRPNQVFTPPRTAHERRATLSRTWKFPFGQPVRPAIQEPVAEEEEEEDGEDLFFGCLEENEKDNSPSVPSSPSAYSYEKTKGAFAKGFKFGKSDNASFFLPGIGFPGGDEEDEEERGLSVVDEEEEGEEDDRLSDAGDDSDMFGDDIGGIRIIFTPPQEEEVEEERKQIQVTSPTKRVSPPPVLPALDFGFGPEDDDNEDDTIEGVIPFNFGRSLIDEQPLTEEPQSLPPPPRRPARPAVASSSTLITPPSSLPRVTSPAVSQRPASPSMIPRPASPSMPSSIPRLQSTAQAPVSTPTKAAPTRATTLPMSPTAFVTPPAKRGGSLMSFIPTPVSSPSPIRTAQAAAPRPKVAIPTSTFIPQPTRKSLVSSATNKTAGGAYPNVGYMNTCTPSSSDISSFSNDREPRSVTSSFYNFFDLGGAANDASSSSQMKSVDFSHDHTFSGSSSSSIGSQRTVNNFQSPPPVSMSSLVSSPFKSLTSYIPLSWSSPSVSSPPRSTQAGDDGDEDFNKTPVPRAMPPQPLPTPKSNGFVSREKQLRKLQMRMQVEGAAHMGCYVGIHCRNCDDGKNVFI